MGYKYNGHFAHRLGNSKHFVLYIKIRNLNNNYRIKYCWKNIVGNIVKPIVPDDGPRARKLGKINKYVEETNHMSESIVPTYRNLLKL